MSDKESLLLALVVLHLLEGVLWLSHGTLLFRRDLRRRFGWVQPGAAMGNRRGGLVFIGPLPPFTGVFAAKPPPLAFSAEGVAAFQTEVLPGTTTLQRSGKSVAWSALKEIRAEERKLILNGAVFLEGDSVHQAHELAKLLRQLLACDTGHRLARIKAVLDEKLDQKALGKTLADFDRATSFLRGASLVLTVFLLLLCPVTIGLFGWLPALWFILPALLLQSGFITVKLRRLHRALYPAADEDRFRLTLLCLLAPLVAMRAPAILSRHLLEGFHPLAVAAELLDKDSFKSLARGWWRDLNHPLLPATPGDAAAAEIVNTFRLLQRDAVSRFLNGQNLAVENLVKPAAPTDRSHTQQCPRCETQFTRNASACRECGGIALADLEPAVGTGHPMGKTPA